MTDLFFRMPLPPRLTNGTLSRSHWATKHRAKKDLWRKLDFLVTLRQLPPPPARPLARATITAALRVWRRMDPDNAEARLKWVVDWLVSRGYLEDDGPAVLTWGGRVEQFTVPRTDQGLELRLVAAEESRD